MDLRHSWYLVQIGAAVSWQGAAFFQLLQQLRLVLRSATFEFMLASLSFNKNSISTGLLIFQFVEKTYYIVFGFILGAVFLV